MTWKQERKRLVRAIQDELQLEDDLIVNEVESAESKDEAISRLKAIVSDAETALAIVEGE